MVLQFLLILAVFELLLTPMRAEVPRACSSLPSSASLMSQADSVPKDDTEDIVDVGRDAVFALHLENAERQKQLELIEVLKSKYPHIDFAKKFDGILSTDGETETQVIPSSSTYTLAEGPVNRAMLDGADAEIAAGNFAFAQGLLDKLAMHKDLSTAESKQLHILQGWIATSLGDSKRASEILTAVEELSDMSREESIAVTWLRGRVAYLVGSDSKAETLDKRALYDRKKFHSFHWAQYIANLIDFAHASFCNGHIVSAERALCQVIQMTNTNGAELADARTLLALCYLRTKHAELAASTLRNAIREMEFPQGDYFLNRPSPSFARAFLNAGRFENLRDNNIRALRYFDYAQSIVNRLKMTNSRLGREIASEIRRTSSSSVAGR